MEAQSRTNDAAASTKPTTEWMVAYKTLKHVREEEYYAKASDLKISTYDFPYKKVTDEMIERYLSTNDFIDTMDGCHGGINEPVEHHAQRIASLIYLVQSGVILRPVVLYCNYVDKDIFRIAGIDDGWHRLRASCYLDAPIRVYLDFNE
jgi:hypothetical protein